MKKAVIIFSGGIDSVCTCTLLKKEYELYGISFSYGQRANQEIKAAKRLGKTLGLKKHRIVDIGFMKELYGNTNVLTSSKKDLPSKFDYSIVVPIRNAIFLSIATAWAFTLNATLVAYGAHKGDKHYPDCRPKFTTKIQNALNEGEIDGIELGIRKRIKIWSPYVGGLTKVQLLQKGHKILKNNIFKTWSCYSNTKIHCGNCESCNNRKKAFMLAKITDKTKYKK